MLRYSISGIFKPANLFSKQRPLHFFDLAKDAIQCRYSQYGPDHVMEKGKLDT